ncbi:uncharacterized protein [Oryza sativa Japonica Group]|uniref:uncharacterized protein n=1 Tax=Oryza sativa subsp. japonica TaxID=39947 RepID=UPI0001C7EF74|nr:mediator of RNA polymerase II transcription subunit 1.1 [Oryza sativa Japonica Group]KAF2942327.1 hypothetical protein DAI22_03g413400 [Oryza sativa Japonica Group]
MSRCFPFPPPGYEKTARPDGQLASHLLEKEKHKEKKHKKDKKDKERKEGKDKKDKERSKDKHRDKKDRKEKHKDKKKDKSKDKSRELEEGTERHSEALHGQKVGESSRKSEEIKDPKSREDLVTRTQNEKGTTNQSVQNFSVSNQRGREGFSAAPALENERTAANKMHSHSINASRKTEVLGQKSISINQQKNGTAIRRGDNITSSSQRTSDVFIAAPTAEKERVKVARPLSNSTDSAPKKDGMGQRINNISILVQKRTDSPNKETAKKEAGTNSPLLPSPANTMHKGNGKVGRPMEIPTQRFDSPSTSSATAGTDRGMPRSSIPSPSITIRRPNGLVRPPESISISSKKPDAGGASPAMGKEKEQGGRILQNNIIDPKQINSKPPTMEKITDGRTERMEKVRDGAPDVAKEDKKSDRHEKKKRKEKDKHKEKKRDKEAKKEKDEQNNNKEHDKLRENSINYQVDNSLHMKSSTPPLAPPADDAKAAQADENLKKRKNHEMNGYLQNHHDTMRPTKLPRPAHSNTPVENGTASHVAAPLSSVKPEAINIEKAIRQHKKEEKINGNQEGQRSSVEPRLHDPLVASENGAPTKKLPHPDSKYLSQIYSIPEAPQMMEWHGHDDQDWLFDHDGTQPKKTESETEADGASQVWAQPLKIDQADVIALPYVIPY